MTTETSVLDPRECPVCHVSFTPAVPHQIYDKFVCSRKASRKRWKARSRIGQDSPQPFLAHVASTMNPTDDILALHARNFLGNHLAKPIVFQGEFNRDWEPPTNVMFVPDTSGGMIMGHEEAFK